MSKEVRKFVDEQIHRGRTRSEIQLALLDAGHDRTMVERSYLFVRLKQVTAFCVLGAVLTILMTGIVLSQKATGNMICEDCTPVKVVNTAIILASIGAVVGIALSLNHLKKKTHDIDHDLLLRNRIVEWIREGRNGLEIRDNLMRMGLPEDNVHKIIDEITAQYYSN